MDLRKVAGPRTAVGVAMGSPQSPATVQNNVMGALNALDAQMRSYTNTFPMNRPMPSGWIAEWITGFDKLLWQFQQYVPLGEWLKAQGLPQAAQWLNSTISDLAGARQKYLETYQNAVREENRRIGIWQDAGNLATVQLQQATAHQQAAFDRANQGWFDINEQNCFNCHR